MGETDRDMLERLLRAADSMLLACAGTNNEVYRKAVNVLDMTVSNIKRILGNNPKLPVDTVVKEAAGDPVAVEKSIVSYILVSANSPHELENIVMHSLGNNWVPYGGISVSYAANCFLYTQAMVLYI